MKVEITFGNPDIYLASAIRGLAAQVEGYHLVRGQTNRMMMLKESFEFVFSNQDQAGQFERVVRKYISSEFQSSMKIQLVSN